MATQEKREKESSNKREPEPIELDLGLGKLSFGGLFKGLGNLIELASKLEEKGGEFKQEKTFTAKGPGGKDLNGIFGVSIRTLNGGSRSSRLLATSRRLPKARLWKKCGNPSWMYSMSRVMSA